MKNADLAGFITHFNGQICLTILEVAGFQYINEMLTHTFMMLQDLVGLLLKVQVIGQ